MGKVPKNLKFKISSGLKNLIGRDLITDDFIAVFELVKNSFDAHATSVKIIFENIEKGPSRIIIIDNGKGMDENDLLKKWLWLGYSAKSDNTEDKTEKGDYRDRIKVKRYYAGAKGIGRFSCDRLGSKLNLITIKDESKAKIQNITVNWKEFEKDPRKEFIKIPVKYQTDTKHQYDIEHGTVLEISELNATWSRDKILHLKDSLSKLIIPSIENGTDKSSQFKVIVEAPDEKSRDDQYKESCNEKNEKIDPRKLVNGPVKNFVFETLNLKTTSISAVISESGEEITTKLTHSGEFIYELTEANEYKNLKNVSYHLFYLNFNAKKSFTTLMGIQPVNYGNIFIYKNGFRVHPYGNDRDDSLGVDARKTQGHSRYLGTRELIGRIEILGDNQDLRETTSRDGGLIKNSTYNQLVKCLYEKVLRRLEKYVVDAREWGIDDEETDSDIDIEGMSKQDKMFKLMASLTSPKNVRRIRYNKKFLSTLSGQQEDSLSKVVKNFKRIAVESNDSELIKNAAALEKRLNRLQEAKKEAEDELEKERARYAGKEATLVAQNKYLLSTAKDISPEALGLIHHIAHETARIGPKVEDLINQIKSGKYKEGQLLSTLSQVKLHSDKVVNLSRIVSRSNFNLLVSEQKADIIAYIKEYISIYKEIHQEEKLAITTYGGDFEFNYRFSLISVSIILDNLISNAKKAGAHIVKIGFEKGPKGSLKISFSDNGKGVSDKLADSIYELGVTTTYGSGIGLHTVKALLKEMGGSISFIGNNKVLHGATFEITI